MDLTESLLFKSTEMSSQTFYLQSILVDVPTTPKNRLQKKREPLIDTLVDEKEQTLKIVAEMPGVEKTDVKVVVDEDIIHIDAEHGEKSYHVNVPIQHTVDSDSPKATYTNGILELTFNLDTKPKGKSVDVL